MNASAKLSSTKNQINNSAAEKRNLAAVVRHFVAAVQEHDNFET